MYNIYIYICVHTLKRDRRLDGQIEGYSVCTSETSSTESCDGQVVVSSASCHDPGAPNTPSIRHELCVVSLSF